MIRKFFIRWSGRIQHIFTGEKREESFIQKLLTLNCIMWWGFWLFLICLGVLALMLPWPVVGRRLIVRGAQNLKNLPANNTLILPNHGSLLGPPLVALVFIVVLKMKAIFNPQKFFPWQTPNVKIMNDSAFLLGQMSPLIPIESNEEGMPKDEHALIKLIKRLQKSIVITFIEGTRSFHGREPRIQTSSGVVISYPFWGCGALVYYSRPTVIPVLIKGEEKIFPEDATLRSVAAKLFFSRSRLEIVFGSPMDISWVPQRKKIPRGELKELATTISERIVQEIAALDTSPRLPKG